MKPREYKTEDAEELMTSLQQAAMEGAQKAEAAKEMESQEEFTHTGEDSAEKAEAPSKDDEGKFCYTSPDNDGFLEKRKEELDFAILQNAGSYSSQRVDDFEAGKAFYDGAEEDRLSKRVRQMPNYGKKIPSAGISQWEA